MRRQMQLRPSQGGKMRGPVGRSSFSFEMELRAAFDDADPLDRKLQLMRISMERACRCGYLLCAKTGPCAPVEELPPVVVTGEQEVERPRFAVNQRVRFDGEEFAVVRDLGGDMVKCWSQGRGWSLIRADLLTPIEDGVDKSPKCRTPEPAEPEPRIEVGMRVRVKADARHPYADRPHPFDTTRGTAVVVRADGTVVVGHPPRRSGPIYRAEDLEPIE